MLRLKLMGVILHKFVRNKNVNGIIICGFRKRLPNKSVLPYWKAVFTIISSFADNKFLKFRFCLSKD